MAQDVTTLKGIEQGRAKYAFESVQTISANEPEKLQGNYKSAAKKLPVLIKTNGLGQTLAFLKSKGGKINKKTGKKKENAHDKLYQQIGNWLQTKDVKGLVPKGELVKKVILLESHEYRHVTVETLALLNWMRRFVDGIMEDVDEIDEDDTDEEEEIG